jgi:hypothetical protein
MVNKSSDTDDTKELKGSVEFQKAPVMGGGGKPSKSPVNDGINKPFGDGLTKRQTQWTKRS